MEYTLLGKSNLKVSRVGFGCMSLPPEQNKCDKLILKAIDYGINFFDTADLYEKGDNEIRLGNSIHAHRKDVVLATKVGNQWRKDGSGWDWNAGKAYIITAVEHSLKRLKTDYIDLYQLHGGMITDAIDETIEAFELLKQQGKIIHYGISSIRPSVIREYVQKSDIISIMMQYSLLDRRPEENVIELLNKHNLTMLIRGSLAQGLLAGKNAKEYLGHSPAEVEKAAIAVHSLSGDFRTSAQTAILYTLQKQSNSVAVTGIRTIAQLDEVATIFNVPVLSAEEISLLDNSIKRNFYTEHR
ncbi:MAG: aldo/keto reductase [Sphingobacteriaceae bacterium]